MKIDKIVFIYIIFNFQLLCSPFAFSQGTSSSTATPDEVQKVKDELDAHYESWAEERRKEYAPAWDDNIQNLNTRAQALVIENERLTHEQESLLEEWKSLQAEMEKKKAANDALQTEVDRKRDLMDDKHWKEKAGAEVRDLQKQVDEKTKELEDLDRRLAAMDKKTQLGKLKLMSLGVDVGPIEDTLKGEEQIRRLQAELDRAADRERVLMYKLDEFKKSGAELRPDVAALQEEIDGLRKKIDAAQSGGRTAPKDDPQAELDALTAKKAQLETEIEGFKDRLDKIENAQAMGIANQRIKALVDEISDIDLKNGTLREEISILKENIAILRMQVKKLEYQADSINALKGKMGQIENFKP